MMRQRSAVIALFSAAAALSGCWVDYDFTQKEVELGTLGEELHKIWRKDAARAADNSTAKVEMLDEQYIPFVEAVDTIAPPDQLPDIDVFLANLLKLVDEGWVPALTRKITTVLLEAAQNLELLEALATPTGPPIDSFVSPDVAPNLLGFITGFPDLVAFTRLQTKIILGNDGFDDNGVRTYEEPSAVSDLIRVLALELRDTSLDDGEDPLAGTVRDMLLVEDQRYNPDSNTSAAYAVLFDDRGYPLAARINDGLEFPFTDANGDGLADIDADGNFVLTNGTAVALRPFAFESDISEPVTRDQFGRAVVPNGTAFQYVDLHRTGLGFTVRQFKDLSAKDTLYDTLEAFKTIMGAKQAHTDDIGAYQGYPQEHPLMDLTHATVHAIDNPGLPDFLEGTSELAQRYPNVLARLFHAFNNLIDILDKYPDSGMTDEQTLVYDIIPVLHEISADPALWSDVMAGLRTPIAAKTGEAMGTMLLWKDSDSVPAANGPYDACFQQCQANFEIGTLRRYDCIRACPMGEIFNEPADLTAPETPENRSAFQKVLHLMRDTAGYPYAMEVEEASIDGDPLPMLPPLLVLPGAAEAFMASIAGNLNLADYVPPEVWTSDLGDLLQLLGLGPDDVAATVSVLSDLFGAHLDPIPRPDQITRLFNQPDIKFQTTEGNVDILLDIKDPECKDGFVMSKHLAYGLFQAEAAGMIDTLHPLAVAFSGHRKEPLFLALLVAMHEHYSEFSELYRTSAGGPSPMKGTNMRSWEPAMKEIFLEGDLFEALNEFSNAVYDTEQATGIPMEEALRLFVENATRPGFANRAGENFVIIDDGRTVSNASKLDFMINAIDQASARLESRPEARDKLRDAVGNMASIMVETERDPGGLARFTEPGSLALTEHATSYLGARAREKQASGELSTWLTVDVMDSLEKFWRSRSLTALIDLADGTLADPNDKATIDAFMDYLLASPYGQAQVLVAVHQLMVQSIGRERWLPIARFLADVIDPDRVWQTQPYAELSLVTLTAKLLNRTLDEDPSNTGIFLIHRGLERPPYKDAPFTVVIDVIARYLSPNPAAETFENPDDYRHFLEQMADYMTDDVHGMERLYELVDKRLR